MSTRILLKDSNSFHQYLLIFVPPVEGIIPVQQGVILTAIQFRSLSWARIEGHLKFADPAVTTLLWIDDYDF